MADAIKVPSKVDGPSKKKLRHMVEDGSYFFKGLLWSPASGQVHPIEEESPLSERDIAHLLAMKYTTPDKRRTLMDRFKLVE